ncbi:Ada metal-binding domain-containing protein [Leucobacter sp. HNU]|uniref:Ada metal-binding domain-containing protein n=1 Tax=Leucobacter sp. HNU TaxID=3236805 RepID=UPI003A809CA3
MTSDIRTPPIPGLDFAASYRAISGRDARWDGRLYLGVTSTGIYCRPSCPARKPKPENCRFFPSAAACVAAGFRACKRCRPDTIPGSPDWNARGDLAARAVRRIRDGAVDEAGVPGLASELAVSERHLRRVLVEEIGASPLQLARTRRAHAARALIEQTDLPLADVAFAAGFGSLRQFGDTMREEFGVAPSRLVRGSTRAAAAGATGTAASDERPALALKLRTRAPFAAAPVRAHLAAHAVPGRDEVPADPAEPTRHAIDTPEGTTVARIDWDRIAAAPNDSVTIPVGLELPSLADTLPAIESLRRLLDLDADPGQLGGAFSDDPLLAPLIAARPGLRSPGARTPAEFALGVVLGQQISLAAARTVQGRLATAFARSDARPLARAEGFLAAPDPARIAETPLEELRTALGIMRSRAETLRTLAAAIAGGLDLGPGADRTEARSRLLELRGIGPWTAELIALRSLGDPDAYPAGDLILHRALGVESARAAVRRAERWRPFRGYAAQLLWADFLESNAKPPRKDRP